MVELGKDLVARGGRAIVYNYHFEGTICLVEDTAQGFCKVPLTLVEGNNDADEFGLAFVGHSWGFFTVSAMRLCTTVRISRKAGAFTARVAKV